MKRANAMKTPKFLEIGFRFRSKRGKKSFSRQKMGEKIGELFAKECGRVGA